MVHRPFSPQKTLSHRPARYAARIKEELSLMVPSGLSDPRMRMIGGLIITDVIVTPDLKNATIKFALASPTDQDKSKMVVDCLNEAAGFLRKELRAKLDSRVTPILAFKYDKGLSNAASIDTLLREAREKDEGRFVAKDSEE